MGTKPTTLQRLTECFELSLKTNIALMEIESLNSKKYELFFWRDKVDENSLLIFLTRREFSPRRDTDSQEFLLSAVRAFLEKRPEVLDVNVFQYSEFLHSIRVDLKNP